VAFRGDGEAALQFERGLHLIPRPRKVCFTGPTRLKLAENLLRDARCELVLGKSADDFRAFHYENRELIQLIADSDVLFPAGRDVIGSEILDSCPNLQAVVKSSIGIETVDVDAATELGILCCNSPTPENYLGVAEATVGLTVALFKRLKFNEAFLRSGGWKEPENRGTLMSGRTVGIIGLGRIGRSVAKRLGPWEMKLLGYDPYVSQETVAPLGVKMVSLEELLRKSDLVTIHVVLTKETRQMIGMRELRLMKKSLIPRGDRSLMREISANL
jgi:D-3-phosphoglycerate dehydrogenase